MQGMGIPFLEQKQKDCLDLFHFVNAAADVVVVDCAVESGGGGVEAWGDGEELEYHL